MKTKLLLAVIALLPACAKVDSQQVKSGGVYATFTVTGDSAGAAHCEAVFQVGSPTGTYVSLEGGDAVTCDGKAMDRTEILGVITYSARVPYDLAKTYTVTFSRPGEPAYQADLTLPEPVTLTWPRFGERVNGAAGVELRWSLGATIAYDVGVRLHGPAKDSVFATETPDKGSKLLPSESLELPVGSTSENFTATVTRMRAGSFPAGLAGGRSWGRQEASVTFTVTK